MADLSEIQETIIFDAESTQMPDAEQGNIILLSSSTVKPNILDSQTETIIDACMAEKAILHDQFIKRFLQLIQESDFEFGFSTPAEDYVSIALDTYGTFAREWISELFLQKFNDPYVTSAILRVIAHFDYQQIYPNGVTIALSATIHKSTEVQECGIRCFENWEAPENLSILYSISYPEGWLNDYLMGVIKGLEAINKHAIRC